MSRIAHFVLLAALVLILAGCLSFPVPLPALDGAQPAPDITLPTPDGQLVSLSDFHGQVLFVNFWGTYCPPCVEEMPDLQATYETLADEPFTILSVNVEEKPAKVTAWMQEHNITLPVVISDDATVNPIFQLHRMPTTWFIDANGRLRGRIEGQMDAQTAQRIARVLLGELQ